MKYAHIFIYDIYKIIFSFIKFALVCSYRIYCCSVTQSCPTLCDPMDCSTLGFPVLYRLTKLAQTHVHWIGDAIQPSRPQIWNIHLTWASIPFLEPQLAVLMAGLWWGWIDRAGCSSLRPLVNLYFLVWSGRDHSP